VATYPGTDMVALDAVLASSIVQHYPYPVSFEEGTAHVVPLPVTPFWVSPEGRPLWACSMLHPVGRLMREAHYYHGRFPSGDLDLMQRKRANTSAGPTKELRVAQQLIAADRLVAVVVANPDEVERLLAPVTHIGKKPAQGHGRVQWTVRPLNEDRDAIRNWVLSQRPVPARSGLGPERSDWVPRSGWTPPYWYAPWHEPCRVPHAVGVDWFEAVGTL